jgi:hypothetical protein
MCVACFTTAQLATVGAVSARWWWVNKRHPTDATGHPDDVEFDVAPSVDETADEEPAPVA